MATRRRANTKNTGYVTVCFNKGHDITFDIGDKKWTINGTNSNLRGTEGGVLVVGKFGETTIKAEDWEEIKKVYGSMDIFTKGYIFANEDTESARDEAEEKSELRHGLEPIDTKKTVSQEDKK